MGGYDPSHYILVAEEDKRIQAATLYKLFQSEEKNAEEAEREVEELIFHLKLRAGAEGYFFKEAGHGYASQERSSV